jgi:large subunit ribosomal protein L19
MNTTLTGVTISPVQMDNRKELGIRAGDTVRVHQKIQDKGKTRIQIFEGVVLARKHGNEPGATFTVRKVASGVGVEKIYPLYSPAIDKVEIVKRAKVRRSKLYFIREKVARQIKRQMRRMNLVSLTSVSEIDEANRVEAEAKAAEAAEAEAAAELAAKEQASAEAQAAAEVEATPEVVEETPAEETPVEEETAPAEETPTEPEATEAPADEEKK